MIKKLRLKNFQAHIDTELEFSDKVNAIIGSTDSGKSSIIRALNLVFTNRPSGVEFINFNHSDCEVELETEKHKVIRKKNNKSGKDSINQYILDSNVLGAVGVQVPEEIEKGLNISNLNIQYQMDAPFLLSDPPPEIARYFNKVINLNIIDESLRKAEAEKRNIASDLRVLNEQKTKTEEELKRFELLPKMEAEVEALTVQEINVLSDMQKLDTINSLLNSLEDLKKKAFPILNVENDILRLLEQEAITAINTRAYSVVMGIIEEFSREIRALRQRSGILSAEAEIIALEGLYVATLDNEQKRAQMEALLNDYFQYQKTLKTIDISAMEQAFFKELPAKCSPDVCPLLNEGKTNV
jgi:DNA repair exonuclease SbcCD ATPase subunit